MKQIYISDWEEWKEGCLQRDIDPYEEDEVGFDLGGGDSETFVFVGEKPEREGLCQT